MSTPTKRVTLILFLIATLISFWGYVESQRAVQAALKAWPGADLNYSGLHRDFLIGLAFLAGTVSLWSRKATKILLCILAVPWGLAAILGLLFLVRDLGATDRGDLIFIVAFLVFAVGLWSIFRGAVNLIPLLSVVFVVNQLLVPRILATPQHTAFEDPSPWSFSRESWWHLAVLALSGVMLLWAIRLFCEEWQNRETKSPAKYVSSVRLSAALGFYSLNLVWLALSAHFAASLPVFGLTPARVELDPNVEFREALVARIPPLRWYSVIRRDELPTNPPSTVWFSPDARSVAYLKPHRTASGTKWAVVHGGTEDPAFDEIRQLRFSSIGIHLAYVARQGSNWFVYHDGRKGPNFASIGDLHWIRQGSEITYEGWSGPRSEDLVSAVVGDKALPPGMLYQRSFDDSGAVAEVRTADGVESALLDGKVVFQCGKGARLVSWWREKEFGCIELRNHKHVLIFHGNAGPELDVIGYRVGPVVSADGKQVAYEAEDNGKEVVVVGNEIMRFKSCAFPIFGAGGRYAYLGCGPQGYFLVVDGEPWPSFQNGGIPSFSPDGKLVGYSAGEHGRSFVVVNGKKGPEFDGVNYKIEFSPHTDNFAYIAWRGNHALVVAADQPGQEFDAVGDPVFSPDGTKVAYRARRRAEQFIVAGGKKGPVLDWVSTPVFSPDGRKVAYAAADGRELWLKVLDVP